MALTAFALEMVALWFQHVMGLKPCVLCIYERCALFGIMGAGLVGAIAPKTPLRYAAIAIWLYSAGKGIALAWEHTQMQLHPSPFMTCDFAARFPSWLPLDKWLPHTCAYRLLAEGKDLPTWHPLLTGSKAAMHGERISVRHIAVKESEVRDWEDHIMNHPNR